MKRIDLDKTIIQEIDDEERKALFIEKRNKILIVVSILLIIGFILFISLRYIGNYGIVVKEKAIYSYKINDDINGIKIIHFSDLLYGEFTDRKQISRLVTRINYTNPDIVVFTGDLIETDYKLSKDEKEYLIKELSKIKSNIGNFAIKGENDDDLCSEIFINSSFNIIEDNTLKTLYIKKSYINLYNMNHAISKESIDDEIFNIVLTHNPDDLDNIMNFYAPDLILSGHNLNGQVRLPVIGALYRTSKYMEPYYKINNSEIFISGGIGNRKLNVRLFNNPSINFLRLRTKDDNKN